MATKPTFATWNYEWATAAAAGRVTDPSPFRSGGWPLGNEFPSNAANYHFRTLGLWTEFFDVMFGTNGELVLDASDTYLEVTTDTPTAQVWTFVGTGTDCEVVSDSFKGTTYLLGVDAVRAQTGGTGTEGDGDVELTSDNSVVTAVATITLDYKAGHATLTDAGSRTSCLRLNYADPSSATAAAGDFATVFPRDETLYTDNLCKTQCLFSLSWDGSGVPSVGSSSGYNHGSATLVAAGGGYAYAGIELTVADDFSPQCIQATIGHDNSIAPAPFLVQTTALAGPTTRIRVTLLFWDGANWIDGLTTDAALASLALDVNVSAY